MIINSYGAAGQVTGSCHQVISTQTFLLDCGLFQGTKEVDAQNMRTLPFDPSALNFVLLSHAHLDHCGRLPLLTKGGFRGPIYTTKATRDLAELILRDSAKIQGMQRAPLYSEADVEDVISRFYPVEERQEKNHGDIIFSFHSAGHLLGAHWIKVKTPEGILAFSGDLGRYECVFYPQPEELGNIDYLILESTNGARITPPIKEGLKTLYEEIKKCIFEKRTVVIPAFSIGRTEEVLSALVNLALEETNTSFFETPIFVDSKLARSGLNVYHQYPSLHKIPLQNLMPRNLFLGDLRQTNSLKREEAKILISASGMMEGGPVLFHAKKYLPDERATFFIVGYQGEGTLGRRLLMGEKNIRILDTDIEVKAPIVQISGLSGHADINDLTRFVSTARGLKNILLVHGEPASLEGVKSVFDKDYKVHIQEFNQPFEL
ncbi:MAG: MBL fold metallo-hydrolase [Tissierellia bacterium]|nr:MBL fold metallo-hydrolase [Tissierellia bacterium]